MQIDIIGSGPAGLSAAIVAHDCLVNKNKANFKINIYEQSKKAGQTILKTGNGRCNYSNSELLALDENKVDTKNFSNIFKKYNNFQFVKDVWEKNFKKGNISVSKFLDDLGIIGRSNDYGMIFPITNKASSVLDALMYDIRDRNINIYTSKKIESLNKKSTTIITTGSNTEWLETFIPNKAMRAQSYSLCPITVKNSFVKKLDGIRVKAKLTLVRDNNLSNNKIVSETGEVLFRKYGISGIASFNISRYLDSSYQNANKSRNNVLILDLLPDFSERELTELLKLRFKSFISTKQKTENKHLKTLSTKRLLAGMLLKEISDVLLPETIEYMNIQNIAHKLKNVILKNPSIYPISHQITKGGVKTKYIDPSSLRFKENEQLYFAGECVDVDGPCGGYNLYWAFLSGIVAGNSAANSFN